MIRSILGATVCGLITYAHARHIGDEIAKPKERRNKVSIGVSAVVTAVGTMAVVGHISNILNK